MGTRKGNTRLSSVELPIRLSKGPGALLFFVLYGTISSPNIPPNTYKTSSQLIFVYICRQTMRLVLTWGNETRRTKRKASYMMAELLPRKLRVLRAERGLTLREAAKLTGVAKETLSDLERGLRHPQDLTLAKIAQGYSLPVEELLEVEEAPASPKDLGLPEWVQAPDLEVFGRKISELPTASAAISSKRSAVTESSNSSYRTIWRND